MPGPAHGLHLAQRPATGVRTRPNLTPKVAVRPMPLQAFMGLALASSQIHCRDLIHLARHRRPAPTRSARTAANRKYRSLACLRIRFRQQVVLGGMWETALETQADRAGWRPCRIGDIA